MNKKLLHEQLIRLLEEAYQGAVDAASRAYDTATNDENIAENKYDTLALEASYLAQGQSLRAEECAADLCAFKKLSSSTDTVKPCVRLGSLVVLLDMQDNEKYIFFGPAAGGLKLTFAEKEIVVVTPGSPLGCAVMNREAGDEVSVSIADKVSSYEIIRIY
ncbi:GreA/GreB family elongation factor [Psychromonas aquimarina]|uniref:GreA/GreB family elongation factor n=1 Tax=Psychromonas aquimarina TaxID=444919 RepID=UPI0003F5CF70|nr:GreA/GreB family elongation factor [Psychromonas aquimarina]